MIDYIKNNKLGVTFIVLALSLLGFMSACAGISVDDFVKVRNVPPAVQTQTGVGSTISLSQAEVVWKDWVVYVETNTDRFAAEISNAKERSALLQGFLQSGFEQIEHAAPGVLSGVPLGGFGLTALSFLGGLLLKRPGDVKASEVKAIADKDYDAGVEAGKQMK